MASDRLWRNKKEKIVILDSSAIMMLFEYSIDLESELTRLLGKHYIVVPSSIIKELEILSENGDGNKKIKAKSSLKLIKKYEIIEAEKQNADESLIELAKKTKGIVVTNDKELRKRLKENLATVVFLRSKNKLALD